MLLPGHISALSRNYLQDFLRLPAIATRGSVARDRLQLRRSFVRSFGLIWVSQMLTIHNIFQLLCKLGRKKVDNLETGSRKKTSRAVESVKNITC